MPCRRCRADRSRRSGASITANGEAEGIGKPEPLRHNLSGWRSRRITQEHRLVYRVADGVIHILSRRHRYE
ncbi:Txe/YoeB family addiction module toxin [Nocardia acidivorans]|uniref:Txe/YoeB family addiction module toxin n=1 Tax=Nocardia acidivorans TaxID=404580 RepID=UPI000A026655